MRLRIFVAVVAGFFILLAGCGKGSKEEAGGASQAVSQKPQVPQVEPGKVSKAIAALDEFGRMLAEFRSMPQPKDQKEAQARAEKITAQADRLAHKYGFQDSDELSRYVSVVVQTAILQEAMDNLDAQLAKLPEDQRNSPQVQKNVQNFKTQYRQAREAYGDSVFAIVKNNIARVDSFIRSQQRASEGR